MKTRSISLWSCILVMVVISLSCSIYFDGDIDKWAADELRGSGTIISEERDVRDFDSIRITGIGIVTLTLTDQESLVVEADDNIMPYILTEVRERTLVLGFTPDAMNKYNFRPSQDIRFELSMSELRELRIDGSGDIFSDVIANESLEIKINGSGMVEIHSLETDELEIDILGSGDIVLDDVLVEVVDVNILGSGDIELSGECDDERIRVGGSGSIHAGKLECDTVTVRIPGSGNATVWAADALDVSILGSGDVRYYGNPSLDISTPGSGSVRGLGD